MAHAHMIDRPNIHMRWGNSAEKRRWMRSLAMLLDVVEDSAILKSDPDRKRYKLVRDRRLVPRVVHADLRLHCCGKSGRVRRSCSRSDKLAPGLGDAGVRVR